LGVTAGRYLGVTAGRRIFYDDEFYHLCSSKNNKMIKLRSMRWAHHVTCVEEKRDALRHRVGVEI